MAKRRSTAETNEPADSDLLEDIDPAEVRLREAQALRNIRLAYEATQRAEAKLAETAREANAAGISWAAIGGMLGMTRQGARAKFSDSGRNGFAS